MDRIPHTAVQLIDRAAALGFDALAITLHDRQLDPGDLLAYARNRGLVLIPGIERTIAGRHVLLLNFSGAAEDVCSFDDLAQLKEREGGLIIAPHPFFPLPSCLGSALEQHAELFDAVEWNGMFTRFVNFNRRAQRWAARHGKPLVGNCDVHRLDQLGTSYSLVDAPPDAGAICAAVRAGRVRVHSEPLPFVRAARIMAGLSGTELALRVGVLPRSSARRSPIVNLSRSVRGDDRQESRAEVRSLAFPDAVDVP